MKQYDAIDSQAFLDAERAVMASRYGFEWGILSVSSMVSDRILIMATPEFEQLLTAVY